MKCKTDSYVKCAEELNALVAEVKAATDERNVLLKKGPACKTGKVAEHKQEECKDKRREAGAAERHMQEKRVSDEDIQEAGLPHTFTTEAVGKWLEAADRERAVIEEGAKAVAADGSESAEGSEAAAQCQGVEATAETYKQETRGLESLVTWLCCNRVSVGATDDEMLSKLDSSGEELKTLTENIDVSCIDE
ncbi:unnamed protein product [Closterium sp. NIES-64]|nr:unnamed protein product [Closterium sp. NIES-64]